MIRAILLFLALSLPLSAEEFPALYMVTGVAADDVLNIRAKPDAKSDVIGSFDPDATGIEVVATSGRWALVNTGEGSGYAALRFLEREPGPDWNSLQTPMTCVGTEPFWSLMIDPVALEATHASPDTPNGQGMDIDHLWPATPWAPAAAVGLPVGTVVLQPAQCSDGMSDRSYGIRVDAFLGTPATTRLSGCCLLALP